MESSQKHLRILILEDDPLDLELAIARLEEHGYECQWEHVETRKDFLACLDEPDYDLILADYNLPTFDGLTALQFFIECNLDIPFILVSGTLGEETAIESLKAGATDYVMKNRISKLGTAVERALREAEEQHQRRVAEEALLESEERYRDLVEKAGIAILIDNIDGSFEYYNDKFAELFGYTYDEIGELSIQTLVHPDDMDQVMGLHVRRIQEVDVPSRYEFRGIKKDRSVIHLELDAIPVLEGEKIVGTRSYIWDITERKHLEQKAQKLFQQQIAVNQLSLVLGETLDLEKIYHAIYHHIKSLVEVWAFIISSYDGEKRLIRAEYVMHKGVQIDVTDFPVIPLAETGQGTQSRVIHTGKPFYTPDHLRALETSKTRYIVDENGAIIEGFPTPEDEDSTRSTLYVPMKIAGQVIGVIQLQSTQLDAYIPNDIDLMTGIANVAAVAIQNSNLFLIEQRRRHISETLIKTSSILSSTLSWNVVLDLILEELQEVISYDTASVQLLRDSSLEIVSCKGFGIPDRVVGIIFSLDPKFPNHHVITSKESLAIADVVQDYPYFIDEADIYSPDQIRSWLGVPLINKEIVIGMIAVDRVEVDPFSKEEIQLVMAFASQAAVAIENARLLSDAMRRLDNIQALQSIDQAITSSLDLGISLNVILDQVIEQLEVDAAVVLLYQKELQALEFSMGRGFTTEALQHTHLRLGQGTAGLAALERRIIFIPNLSQMDTSFLKSPAIKAEKFVSYYGIPLVAKGELVGVLEIFNRTQLDPTPEWKDFLSTLAGQAAIAIENTMLFGSLQRANLDLHMAYDSTLEGWAKALELRDMETEGHSRRVVDMTMKLARKMGIRGEELADIRRGALLHDIGKMGVPDAILQKPGKLTDEEWEIMRQHPVYAYEWLGSINYLKHALDIPYCHHEKWDGTGYPRGLKGDQIPLAARIFAIVDVWDALCSVRPYRKAWPEEKVLRHIKEQSGKHFDLSVVEALLDVVECEQI